MNWKRTVGQRLRHITPLQARRLLDRIRAHGITIDQPTVRDLTGGYASQNINFYVVRKLGEKAGFVRIDQRKNMVRQFDPTEQAD